MELKLYSISDLTEILKLHRKTILRFIHEGKLPARKIGRSWMVTEQDLKAYCHGTSHVQIPPKPSTDYETLNDRIRVSAVVEINEQDSEEASRISNSLLAMLNGASASDGSTRFDFFYYPEARTSKYTFYGTPASIRRLVSAFEVLCQSTGGQHD